MNELVPTGTQVVPADAGHMSMPANSARSAAAPTDVLAGLPRDIELEGYDRDVAGDFAAYMAGAPPQFIHQALRWYQKHSGEIEASRERLDTRDQLQCQTAMRAEWSTSYEANMRAVRAVFQTLPAAVQTALENAELDDGSMALNSPAVLRWLFDLARRPPGGDNGVSVLEEMASIQSLMGNRQSAYWKGPKAEMMQARYRYLISLQHGSGK